MNQTEVNLGVSFLDIYEIRNALQSGRTIFDLPLRVTYYARVSTDKDEQLHSLSAQVQYYSEFIQTCRNWTLVDGYVDEGISGTSASKRENFMRMIDDARGGRFDFIVTKEISRFSRNTLDSIHYTQESGLIGGDTVRAKIQDRFRHVEARHILI